VATVGWIDDRRGLPVFTRLFIHLTAGVAVGVLAFQPEVSRPVTVVTFAFWIFWTATSINFVNFMDGINGFVALQIAIFAGSLTLFGWRTASASWYPVAVATACLGFLPWNFPRARIFLGDVGSGALGFLVPVLAIVAMREQGVGFLQAYLPLTPLLGDATVTLIGRWYRGEKLTEAHRHHLYQRSVQLGAGHTRVTLAYAATSLVGAVIAHIEAYRDLHLTLMYIAAVCLLGVLVEWRLRMSQE
jgi:UDP-N-acetylmuramyl pentapeptide phosphotransferase/UDP-N-acetylglucosamine-1-phosphate transferase